MNLDDVMDEIAAVANTVEGLRAYGHPMDDVSPPAAFATYPSFDFDAAFQRGLDRWTGGLLLIVGDVWARATRNQLSGFVSGSGPRSIKAAFHTHDWQACDYARPTGTPVPDVINLAGVDVLTYFFELDIAGPGDLEA